MVSFSRIFTQEEYSIAATLIPQQVKYEEDRLPVRNDQCRSRFLLHAASTTKVCLFFHGFTAAPYQFLPLGQVLYEAGYNVLIPRLPGHGIAGQWGRDNPPPLPTEVDTYKTFALYWLQQAQAFGHEVVVGGLSGGATMAGWLALEQSQWVDRALLFAAYLRNSNQVIDLFVKIFNTYFEWMTDESAEETIGYKGFELETLRVFLDLGNEVLDQAKTNPASPMFIVSSDADQAVNNGDHQELFERLLKYQPQTWYYSFDRALDIPHTMMTKAEGNPWEHLLNTIAKAFIQSDLTWAEIEEIADQMTEDKPFSQVIAELNLVGRASPDLAALMTLIDKREMENNRNSD
jgi:esterase/lipase